MSHAHELIERINTALDLYNKLEEKGDLNWDILRDVLAVYINKQVEDASLIMGIEYK